MDMKFDVGDRVVIVRSLFNFNVKEDMVGLTGVVHSIDKDWASCPYRIEFDDGIERDVCFFHDSELELYHEEEQSEQEINLDNVNIQTIVSALIEELERRRKNHGYCREYDNAILKLEEAIMWLDRKEGK